MTTLRLTLHTLEQKHPCLTFTAMLICLPLLLVLAVGASTSAIVLPIALLAGWL